MPTTAVPPRPAFLDGPLRLYIGGQRVSTSDRMATVDPATGETLAEVPVATPAEVDLAVQAAADAFRGWRAAPPTQRARLLWTLADLIEEHSEEPAAIEVLDVGGGEARPDGLEHGFFIEPTVVRGVGNSMRVAQEEIFGPVLSVISWRSDSDLAALANAVPYGLAAGIWTSDTSRALRLAEELEAGAVWINTYGMFDVAVPFGGRKHSGFGRELGEEALEPYLTSKSVWVDLQSAAAQAGQAISR